MVILSNYEDATKLLQQAKYSSRQQTVMLQELYVSVTPPPISLIWLDNRMGFDWGLTPMPYGPEWRLSRKLLHEQFNRHEIAYYAAQQEAGTHVMLQGLLNAPD